MLLVQAPDNDKHNADSMLQNTYQSNIPILFWLYVYDFCDYEPGGVGVEILTPALPAPSMLYIDGQLSAVETTLLHTSAVNYRSHLTWTIALLFLLQ